MSRTMLLVLVASLLAGTLSGCSELGGAGGPEGAAEGPLSGEWIDLTGSTIRFTGDVFYASAEDETRPHYRYEIASDSEITLIPLTVVDGVETEDVGNQKTEAYSLDGDHLSLHGWGEYYRPESQALADAEAERQTKIGGQTAAFDDRLKLEACRVVRANYLDAFEAWFDKRYTDRDGHGYTIGQYIKYKNVGLDWDFARLKRTIGPGYETAAAGYEENLLIEEYRNAAGFVEWIYAGACPSDGTYTVTWGLDEQVVPQISCSIHGRGD